MDQLDPYPQDRKRVVLAIDAAGAPVIPALFLTGSSTTTVGASTSTHGAYNCEWYQNHSDALYSPPACVPIRRTQRTRPDHVPTTVTILVAFNDPRRRDRSFSVRSLHAGK